MTYEEIEKALTQCGDLSDFDCKGCPLEGEPLCLSIILENALDYINRLKAEKEDMHDNIVGYKAYIDNHEEIWKRNAEIDKAIVRKDTAKEILQIIYELCKVRKEIQWDDVWYLVKRYGVEMDYE